MSSDGWKIVYDLAIFLESRVGDLHAERQHCVGPMEELGVLERIQELTDLQVILQAKLHHELEQTAQEMRREVTHGEKPDGKAKQAYTEAVKELYE